MALKVVLQIVFKGFLFLWKFQVVAKSPVIPSGNEPVQARQEIFFLIFYTSSFTIYVNVYVYTNSVQSLGVYRLLNILKL